MLRVGVDSRAFAHPEDLDTGKETEKEKQKACAHIESLTCLVLEECH
jgi:hypothetical protein